ncbi:MAG: hypothetical protein Q7K39_05175 [Candidatus Magasanikbacteria bacterium]|nr:hypothetical protein [Candidatus Magasanikbacteria bacterium]
MYLPRLFIKDWWVASPMAICILTQGYLWWYLSAHLEPSAEQFFLHYNSVFGVDLVGPWWQVFLAPLGGLILIALNFGVGLFLYNRDRFLSRALSVAAAIFLLGLVITAHMLVGINS